MRAKQLESVTGPPSERGEITIRRFAVRRRILAVAKHRFARFGYAHVSLKDVASSADLDWDDFLRYFHDKDTLLTAILDDGWKDVLPRVKELASSSASAHSALLGVFAFMTGILQKDEDLVRLMSLEGRRPDPANSEMGFTTGYHGFMQVFRELVVRGQRDGSFRSVYHPQVAASMLVGAFEGMLRDRLVAEQERSITPYRGSDLMAAFDALVTSLKN
jgi:AcrR family transcriptional regulator